MSRKRTSRARKQNTYSPRYRTKSSEWPSGTFLFVMLAVSVIATVLIAIRASQSDRKLFSISIIALLAGMLVESLHVFRNWRKVVQTFICAYATSFFAFLPGKREKVYNVEMHIEMWPYFFLFFFLLYAVIANKEKVTAKLTEGITLLLSISMLYWLLDINAYEFGNWILVGPVIVATLYSGLNALTSLKLSRNNRLWLSIWSTIVVFSLAIDNIYHVFKNGDLEASRLFSDNALLAIQYFLLGISAIYIMQNFLLLTGFLPNRSERYSATLKETTADHIQRYSEHQVSTLGSITCILYATSAYYLNYTYDVLPRGTMIWLVIASFPIFLAACNWIKFAIFSKSIR